MSLKKYDNKCVRIITKYGETFEGNCIYNDKEYNECEYNRDEESLVILSFMFFKSDIKKVENLEKVKGPYGHFSSSYGLLEELIIEDGIESIEDALFSEDDEHIYRILICLNKYLNPDNDFKLDNRKEVLKTLRELINYNTSDKIQEEANKLLEMWG